MTGLEEGEVGGRLPYLPDRPATRDGEGQRGHSSGEGVIASNTSGARQAT